MSSINPGERGRYLGNSASHGYGNTGGPGKLQVPSTDAILMQKYMRKQLKRLRDVIQR